MEKRRIGSLVVLLLLCASFLFVFGRFTGYVISGESEQITVIRFNEVGSDNIMVHLFMSIPDNLIAVQQNLSENCSVTNYSVSPEVAVSEFNPNESTWIIADYSNLQVELDYPIANGCSITGEAYYLLGENDLQAGAIGQNNSQTVITPVVTSTSSGGGSSGGGATIGSPATPKNYSIAEVKTLEEFNKLKNEASEKPREARPEKEVSTTDYNSGILLAIIFVIVILAAISIAFFVKSSKK